MASLNSIQQRLELRLAPSRRRPSAASDRRSTAPSCSSTARASANSRAVSGCAPCGTGMTPMRTPRSRNASMSLPCAPKPKRPFGDHGGENRGIAHRPAHRTRRVLARRNGHHALAADDADRGFEADQAVDRGRREDGAVGLGTDRRGAETRRGRDARAGARPGRVSGGIVGIADLAAHAAPAAAGARRAKIRPLAQVGLAQDDGARGTQIAPRAAHRPAERSCASA